MMTKLYLLDLHKYEDGLWQALLPKLALQRQQKALACRLDPARMRMTCAGWLLQNALEQAGIAPDDQVFAFTDAGKPYLPHIPELHFSLSHSGSWAACAVSDHPVGVDVELPRCSMAVAKRHFHPEELRALENLSQPEQADQLNRLWTGKEAFLKMLGCGITVPLDSFCIRLGDTAKLEQTYTDKPYQLFEYKLGQYRLCLCAMGIRPQPEIIE